MIAEAFEWLEERHPHLPELATEGQLRQSELRLQKEIEQVRAELRETELRLKKEIEEVRADLRQTEHRLQKEITQVKIVLLKWLVPLMFAQIAAIAALVKLL